MEFTIPLDEDELTRTYFGYRDPVSLPMLDRNINAITMQLISETEPCKLVHEKLDLFLSVIVHGKKVELVLLLQFFGKIFKILQNLIGFLEKRAEQTQELEVDQNEKVKLLFANKALAYVVSTTLCLIEDLVAENNNNNEMVNVDRRKKPAQKTDTEEEWESQREKAIETVQRWLQLPLKNLWSPPIVEDSFVGTVSQICYKILEKTKDIKSKTTQTLIFQILGTLVKRYNHGIACVVRIIQLAKSSEASAVGTGVVLMATECSCTGLIKEIAQEIAQNEIGEADARNVCTFLEPVATAQPGILPLLKLSRCNVLRRCVINVLGTVIPNALTGDNLSAEMRDIRDDCLDYLEDHSHDTSPVVRSNVLETWSKLCLANALPESRQDQILQSCLDNLENNVAGVGKAALPLLKEMLQKKQSNASQVLKSGGIFYDSDDIDFNCNLKSRLGEATSKVAALDDMPNVFECKTKCDSSTQTGELLENAVLGEEGLQEELVRLKGDKAILLGINSIMKEDFDRLAVAVDEIRADVAALRSQRR